MKIHALSNGQRTEPRTADLDVEATIDKLDGAGHWGHWGWVRQAALWQEPAQLSEDEQLAAVLNELADPDHPEYNATCWITRRRTRARRAGSRHVRSGTGLHSQ